MGVAKPRLPGVAGCHIEDQVFLERIRSAIEARTDPDFVIIARTDARNAKSLGGDTKLREMPLMKECGG